MSAAPKFATAKIYVIRAPGTDRIYIGSTIKPLNVRLREHYLRALAGGSCRSREIVTLPGHTIECLEPYPCDTLTDLRKREGWHIRQNSGKAVNKNIAGRSREEYFKENAEAYREKALAWYYSNIPRRRAYEAANREKILNYQKTYYETVLKQRRAEKSAARAAERAAAKAERDALKAAAKAAKEAERIAKREAKAATRAVHPPPPSPPPEPTPPPSPSPPPVSIRKGVVEFV